MSVMGQFGAAEVMFAFPGQRIPAELQVEFELLRVTEKEPALLRDWIARLQRKLQADAQPLPWSILCVAPGMERRVRDALGPKTKETPHGAGLNVYVPLEKYRPRRSWHSRTRALMSGYVLAEIKDDDDLNLVKRNYAVRRILCQDGEPVQLPAIWIGSLVLFEACGAFDRTWNAVPERGGRRGRRPTRRKWEKGEQARVVEGPFGGFIAEIIAADHADRMEVLVTIFGRATPVELDEEMLEALA